MPNAVAGLEAFLEEWDRKRSRAPARGAVDTGPDPKGPGGQINVEGSAICLSASIYVPDDPRFVDALEPGVRDLCMGLIEKLDCITYSSCEGHRSDEGGRFRPRHVGIVARDTEEAARLEAVLEGLCQRTNREHSELRVRVLLVVSQVAGDRGEWPCFDLLFFSDPVSEREYFLETEVLGRSFAKNLREFSA